MPLAVSYSELGKIHRNTIITIDVGTMTSRHCMVNTAAALTAPKLPTVSLRIREGRNAPRDKQPVQTNTNTDSS
jgi:hypothetical protein